MRWTSPGSGGIISSAMVLLYQMHRISRLTTVLAVLGWLAAAHAQTTIATINLRRVFDGYWKTKAASADLRGRTEEYDQDFRKLFDQYQKANEAYRQLVAKAGDSATTAEEKKKLDNTALAKAGELREMEAELNQFLRHSRSLIGDKERRLRLNILAEINAVVAVKAKAGNYDLVLDTSGDTANNVPAVQYTNGKYDLTEAVLEELNSRAPPEPARPETATEPTSPQAQPAKEEKKPALKEEKAAPKPEG